MGFRKTGVSRDFSTTLRFGGNDKTNKARVALRKIGFPASHGRLASSLPNQKAGKMPACRVRLEA